MKEGRGKSIVVRRYGSAPLRWGVYFWHSPSGRYRLHARSYTWDGAMCHAGDLESYIEDGGNLDTIPFMLRLPDPYAKWRRAHSLDEVRA